MRILSVKSLKSKFKPAAAGLLAVTAAGCGGGGGGGSPASVALAPTAATTAASPKALLIYIPVSSTGVAGAAVMPAAASDLTFARATSAAAGNTLTVSATGNLASGQGTASTAAMADVCASATGGCSTTSGGPNLNSGTASSATSAISVLKNYGPGNLAYATYGYVQMPNGTAGTSFGGYHNGTPTATSSLPTNVTATYTGLYAGALFTAGSPGTTNVAQQNGTANLTANFTSSTVTGTVTNLTTTSAAISASPGATVTSAAGYGLGMTGTISGGNYTGTAGYNNGANSAAAGTVTASGLTGGFYGPGAAETAGALMIKGTDPSGKSSQSITVGAFGARKN
jgi:C-lobe and N-lobe beta barrels of Tf-binding protein B